MFRIRLVQNADYEAVAAVHNQIQPEPIGADTFRDRDARTWQDPKVIMTRLVAEAACGLVAGYGVAAVSREDPEQSWYNWVGVHPDWRRQGAGRRLADALEQLVREHSGKKITSQCRGTDEAALAWAMGRGFAEQRRRTESVLDLTAFDMARFAGVVDRVRQESGILFRVVEAIPPDMRQEVFDTDVETSRDHPEYEGTDQTYAQWTAQREHWDRPMVWAFAMDGDRVAGYSVIQLPTEPGEGAYTRYTCVRRAYRGRGIALTTKLLTIDSAIARGVPHMRTNNNPENGPMLAVNEKLGYQLIPGPHVLLKTL